METKYYIICLTLQVSSWLERSLQELDHVRHWFCSQVLPVGKRNIATKYLRDLKKLI